MDVQEQSIFILLFSLSCAVSATCLLFILSGCSVCNYDYIYDDDIYNVSTNTDGYVV